VLTAAKKKLLVGYWRIGSTKDSQGHYWRGYFWIKWYMRSVYS
jgi:hypothetical protein